MSRELAASWDADQAAVNAADILNQVRAHTGRYRELRRWRVTCSHGDRVSLLVRYFAGPDDSGEQRWWVWVAGRSLKGRAVPPLCAPLPRVGELVTPLLAVCGRCRSGWVVFPAGPPEPVAAQRAASEMVRLVVRVGLPARADWAGGQPTEYVEGSSWVDGPGRVVMLRVNTPKLGTTVN